MVQCELLGIVVDNHTGTESLHKPSLEQVESMEGNGINDSTYQQCQDDDENGDDNSIPSIPSIQDASIHHELDNFDPTDPTATTTIVPDEVPINNSIREENAPVNKQAKTIKRSVISSTGVNEGRRTAGVHNEDTNSEGMQHVE
eukprot:5570609-Ditylum_brightwellii.AAC.2